MHEKKRNEEHTFKYKTRQDKRQNKRQDKNTTMATFEEAKQLLEAQSASGGGSVYDHVSSLLLKIISEKPEDPLAAFEAASLSVKGAKYAQKMQAEGAPTEQSPEVRSAQTAWADSILDVIKTPEEGPRDTAESVQDLVGDAALLQWAGVSFGEEETFALVGRMQALVAAQAEAEEGDPISKIRLWGKILGSKGVDYYVFECNCDSEVDIPEGVRMEGREGVNRLTYWVKPSNDAPATKLPHVTEEQIVVAGQIKRFFTGDLAAPVSGYPPFNGTEAHFLRAQIARISADTFVAPNSFFGLDDNEEAPAVVSKVGDEDAPAEALGFDALEDAGSWQHFEMAISSMGRVRDAPMVQNEEGEDVPDPWYDGATKSREDALASLADEEGTWKVMRCPSAGGPGSVSVAKSVQWPGAVAVAPAGVTRFVNCYVGYGVAASSKTYTPPALPALQSEFAQAFTEQADVTEAPPEPEAEGEEED